MDVSGKIAVMRMQRGWTDYELAKRSGVPQSTVATWFQKGIMPTISSLEKVCHAFGITLSQFFNEGDDAVTLTEEQMLLLDNYSALSETQKEKVNILIVGMLQR